MNQSLDRMVSGSTAVCGRLWSRKLQEAWGQLVQAREVHFPYLSLGSTMDPALPPRHEEVMCRAAHASRSADMSGEAESNAKPTLIGWSCPLCREPQIISSDLIAPFPCTPRFPPFPFPFRLLHNQLLTCIAVRHAGQSTCGGCDGKEVNYIHALKAAESHSIDGLPTTSGE